MPTQKTKINKQIMARIVVFPVCPWNIDGPTWASETLPLKGLVSLGDVSFQVWTRFVGALKQNMFHEVTNLVEQS